MVQWLGLGAFAAAGMGAIPGRGTKIPQAVQRGQKKKKLSMDSSEFKQSMLRSSEGLAAGSGV